MGTTLQNGVYLPNEGERNCYAGLKTNWEILDQKVADVTALQQAVAGALHREIVESLPTTDIDPNTIYMVLSGTSATENVYNEFMYVNNAWELIGTSATDLTNYYTKGDVDGLLLLKANASDLTSHTGDTTIHVTTADKNKWNNQTYVFRYSSTALVASSTNSNTLLDNTDNLKVGDKVIDSDGVLFSITAIDTANSTFTVGSALIDLALDANVVHTSGNETVGGQKTFSSDITLQGTTTPVIKTISNIVQDTSAYNGSVSWVIRDKDNLNNILESALYKYSAKSIDWQLKLTGIDNGVSNTKGIRFSLDPVNNVANFIPIGNNSTSLGNSSTKWKEVYATNYYYGSNNVEFSTKFVTTDTNQTISGEKEVTSTLKVNRYLQFNNPNIVKGTLPSSDVTPYRIYFGGLDYNTSLFNIDTQVRANGVQRFTLRCAENVVGGNDTRFIIVYNPTDANPRYFYMMGDVKPYSNNSYGLGDNSFKWKSINGLEPSALGMPDFANGIDISSYITIGNTDDNYYTPPVNGWLWARLLGNGLAIQQGDFGSYGNYVADSTTGDKYVEACLPVTKNVQATIRCRNITGIVSAKFYPCQGNV